MAAAASSSAGAVAPPTGTRRRWRHRRRWEPCAAPASASPFIEVQDGRFQCSDLTSLAVILVVGQAGERRDGRGRAAVDPPPQPLTQGDPPAPSP